MGCVGSDPPLKRVEITRTVDGVHIYGTTVRTDPHAGNVTIQSSSMHHLPHYADNSHPDGSHNDAIQVAGGRNISITGNRFDGQIYNAVLMATQGRNDVSNLTFANNWAAGGSCSVNIYDKNAPYGMPGVVLTGNVFTRGSPQHRLRDDRHPSHPRHRHRHQQHVAQQHHPPTRHEERRLSRRRASADTLDFRHAATRAIPTPTCP